MQNCPMNEPSKSKAEFPSLLQSAEDERSDAETLRALQFALDRPESERQILRCAPPFDAQSEHEKDLEYESRVDYASWETDQEDQ